MVLNELQVPHTLKITIFSSLDEKKLQRFLWHHKTENKRTCNIYHVINLI